MDDTSADPQPFMTKMTEDELASLLQREEADATSYYDSEIASAQAIALDRYFGKIENDDLIPNRSQVVTPDIRDTVNWMLPALMRAFAPSDELITVTDNNLEEDSADEKDSANYLGHVFFKDNSGQEIVHDFCFDALVQKVGIARVYWCDPEPKPPKLLEGLTVEQLMRYHNDPAYQILEAAQDGVAEIEADDAGAIPETPGEVEQTDTPEMPGQEGPELPQVNALVPSQAPQGPQTEPTFSIRVLHRPRMGRAKVEVIPPEQFAVSRRARSLVEADYQRWQHEVWISEVIREFPDKRYNLEQGGGRGDELAYDTDRRVVARFQDDGQTLGSVARHDDNRRKAIECIEYIRVDYDGDGIVELRRVRRIGDVILENDAVEESEFEVWSPVRISHRLIGMSLADLLLDIQRIRTALMRRGLDGLSRSLTPRTYVNKQAAAADPTLVDQIMAHDVGDVIMVNGNPNDVVREQTVPDVSSLAFSALEHMDRRSEEASGVNRHAMGIQPQAITDTKGGIEALQSAANMRIEQVARWLGLGLEKVMGKLLRTLIAHQDHARIVKINGRRLQFDPRRWSDEMAVSVHVGMAGDSREKRLTYLNILAQKQEQVLLNAGPANPLASLKHLRNTYALMVEAMGYRDPGRFFGEIPDGWQPPDQQDPKALEAQGKAQIAQAEMQQKGQIEMAKLQQEGQIKTAQAERDAQMAREIAAQKSEFERQAAVLKADTDRAIAEMRIRAEAEIAAHRTAAEMDLARWKAELEAATQRTIASTQDRLPTNRPGGRLDA